jgi:hypothetical protein
LRLNQTHPFAGQSDADGIRFGPILTFRAHLEMKPFWVDIFDMAKTAIRKSPSKTVPRDSRSGQFLGQASDGTWIARPPFKPEGFTVRQLQKVIRELRKTEADPKLG